MNTELKRAQEGMDKIVDRATYATAILVLILVLAISCGSPSTAKVNQSKEVAGIRVEQIKGHEYIILWGDSIIHSASCGGNHD